MKSRIPILRSSIILARLFDKFSWLKNHTFLNMKRMGWKLILPISFIIVRGVSMLALLLQIRSENMELVLLSHHEVHSTRDNGGKENLKVLVAASIQTVIFT
jgi:hypothetical protein